MQIQSAEYVKDVQEGNVVWAHHHETGEEGPRQVVGLIQGAGMKDLVTFTFGDDALTATDGHPFWSVTRQAWIDAGDLVDGEYVLQADGGVDVVDAVQRYQLVTTVYNFEVAGLHTYFVDVDGEGVLVSPRWRNKAAPGRGWRALIQAGVGSRFWPMRARVEDCSRGFGFGMRKQTIWSRPPAFMPGLGMHAIFLATAVSTS